MKTTNAIKTGVFGLVAAAMIAAVALPQFAQAQSYDYNRAQLIAEIQRLLAELARVNDRTFYYYQPNYSYQYSYNPGRVLGASTGSRVEVETQRAIDVEDDEATVYGTVDLNGQSYATVWFEYGEDDDDLDEDSRSGRIDRNDYSTFRADLEDLDEDERYYYRAVARGADGRMDYGAVRSFYTDEDRRDRDDDDDRDDEPDVDTGRATDIDEDSAEFDGDVDMNDFRNGFVFFAYGEDEDQIEDIEDDYDEFNDIDEDGDNLQLIVVDRDLDGDASYDAQVWGLDDDTRHYFTICVEYEDEDDDETITCGSVEDFETDRD